MKSSMKSPMKSLKIYVKESIFDDVEDIANNDTILIEQFLKDNYNIDGTYVINKDGTVDVKGNVCVKNKNIESLTNGLFRFGKVDRGFSCAYCTKLKSLKGAPEKVSVFDCSYCVNLTSLKGSPVKISKDFSCVGCKILTSLEGTPREVGRNFKCSYCINLISLKGSPEKVGGIFVCIYCKRLTSLKDAPEKIGRTVFCTGCNSIKITEQDRKKYNIED